MTHRQRVLNAARFRAVDQLPWLPRLDLWYKSQVRRNALPPEWRGASLMDITDALGVGYHAVIPDFLDVEEPHEVYDRLLGLDHVRNQPFRMRFCNVERIVEERGETVRVTYRTPRGELTGKLLYTEQMKRDGVTLLQVTERVVKSADDLPAVAALFEDLEVEPDETRYVSLREEVGERGEVVAFAGVAASPVHHLLKDLCPYDWFFYEMHDHPQALLDCAKAMQGYFDATLEACAQSCAELVHRGANYDVSLTPPRLFEEHIAPGLKDAADQLHAAGKLLVTHTDGENDGLLDLYLQAGVDLADSVCPKPMTRLPLATYREAFGRSVAIWGGVCSVSVLPGSFSDAQFETHVDEVLAAAGDGRGIILSIADTTPPDASLERIGYIGERVKAWTPG